MPILPASGQNGAFALRDEWDADIKTKPNEEAVIIDKFGGATGVEKIQNILYVRILPVITGQTLNGSTSGASGTYHEGTILRVSTTSTFSYAGVELNDDFVSKLTSADAGAVKAGYRKQLMKALNTKNDVAGATLFASLSQQVGLPSNFDQALLLAAKGLLVQSAKEFVKFNTGSPTIYLCYHPTQMQYVDAIPGITHAYARGDSANPTVRGVVHDAWGLTLTESGNIYTAAGVAYNAVFTRETFLKGWNLQPTMKKPQDDHLLERLIAESEIGLVEVFDEAGVAILSPV